ncbi:MAG: hypothetical protein ABJP70_00210 [Erythrobacter sp.]
MNPFEPLDGDDETDELGILWADPSGKSAAVFTLTDFARERLA